MATVALSSLRSTLQTFLKDTEARKWSEDDLDTFLNLAITKWTSDLPIKSANTYTVVDNQHAYDLPENAVGVSTVYGYFNSTTKQEFLAPMNITPGAWESSDEPRRYVAGFPLETQFYLPFEPNGTTFTLYYGAKHTPLVDDTDTLDMRTHSWGELAVLYYASYLAYLPLSANAARLEQWKRKNDLNVDNPLMEQALHYRKMYEDEMAEHGEVEFWEFIKLESA